MGEGPNGNEPIRTSAGPEAPRETSLQPPSDSRRVLTAMGDDDCRSILARTARRPQTVGELVDQSQIPTATAYRKVNELLELGLLTERVRVQPGSRNAMEYALGVSAIRVEIDDRGGLVVDCSPSAPEGSWNGEEVGANSEVLLTPDD